MHVLMEAWTARVAESRAGTYVGQEEHRAIFDAVARGDPDGAADAMIDHLTRGAARLSDILGFDWRLEY
jgi:DNA-binding FadR family transcriptional regulator